MKVKAVVSTLVVVTMLSFAAVGAAEDMKSESGKKGYKKQEMMKNLTPEQREILRTENQKFKQETQPIRQELETKKKVMKDVMSAEKVDKAAALNLHKEIAALQEQLFEKRLDFRIALQEKGIELGAGKKGHRGKKGRGGMKDGGREKTPSG